MGCSGTGLRGQGDYSIILNLDSVQGVYSWSTGSVDSAIWVSTAGTYWSEITNADGCVFSDTINITIQPATPFSLGEDTTLCAGSILTLDPGVPAVSFAWPFGGTDSTFNVSQAGTYWCAITSGNGCVTSDTINVSYQTAPVLNLGNLQVLCIGQTAVLDAGNPGMTIQWGADTGVVIPNLDTANVITASDSGLYWVSVTNSLGCESTDTVLISISANPMQARFLSVSEAVVGDTIQFISLSYPDSVPHEWTFGDGVMSNDYDPLHAFFLADTFNVQLKIGTSVCGDSITKPVVIALSKTRPVLPKIDSTIGRYNPIREMNFYPNPVKDYGTLEFELEYTDLVFIDYINVNGSLLQTEKIETSKYKKQVYTGDLSPGVYIIRVRVNNQQETFKIIKI
jgi:hypothetical protein